MPDSHANQLHSQKKSERCVPDMQNTGDCSIHFVELARGCLLLRPPDLDSPLEALTLVEGQNPDDLIAGGVAWFAAEI